jgi:glucose-6-phosphate 1-epimerase
MIDAQHLTVLGQPAMRIQAPDGAEATVLLHGGQIVSWIPAGDQERFYLSPMAVAGDGKSVRGGVPVIFPQFSDRGPLPRHGFARDRRWQWVESVRRGGVAIAVLRLSDDARTRAIWPHAFEAELTLVISGLQLDIELAVTNTGQVGVDLPFSFSAALHSYLLVDDVRRAKLGGLFAVHYTDNNTGKQQHQEIDPFSFAGEIDRTYDGVTQPLSLATAMGRMVIANEGFPDVVVWNPGPAKAAAMADLPDDDWLSMLCVEAAAVHTPVTLAPGQEWTGRQSFSV